MKRRLFQIASALSLLICIAATLLWVQTCWMDVEFNAESSTLHAMTGEAHSLNIAAQRGRLAMTTQWYVDRISNPADWPADGVTHSAHGWSTTRDEFNVSFPWFYWGTIKRVGLVSRRVSVPLWSVCAAAAVMPIWYWYLHRLRENARLRTGCCVKCGYDLRATPDRCPECGTVALHT